MLNRKGNGKAFVVIVASVVSIGIFVVSQLTNTTAYVATKAIPSGTKITDEYLQDGSIVAKSIPKSLTNEYTIKKFEDISGQFLKYPVGPGKTIFSFDFAGESDLRNNALLRENNLEGLTLNVADVIGGSSNITLNDRLNIYTTDKIDLSKFVDSGNQTVLLSDLPEDIKNIFVEIGGFEESDEITVGEYRYTKLLAQNVPVVEIKKDENDNVVSFTMGVTTTMAENIFLSYQTGTLAMNILPYNEDGYKQKESKGTLEFLQYGENNKEVIKDSSDR